MLAKTPPFAGPSRSGETFVLYAQLGDVGLPRYSRVYLRKMIARGQFPAPVQLSKRRIAWRLSDLEDWKRSRPVQPVTSGK